MTAIVFIIIKHNKLFVVIFILQMNILKYFGNQEIPNMAYLSPFFILTFIASLLNTVGKRFVN